MEIAKFKSEMDRRNAELLLWRRSAVGLFALTALLAIALLYRSESETKIILVPPEIKKEMWVQGEALSVEYLRETGTHLAQQLLTVTPSTAMTNVQRFLRHVAPAQHAKYKMELENQAQSLMNEGVSTVFFPLGYKFKGNRVSIYGEFLTIIGTRHVATARRAWNIEFEVMPAGVFIKNFYEVDGDVDFSGFMSPGSATNK